MECPGIFGQMPDTAKLAVEERPELETRHTLAMDTVIGREFTLQVLQAVTGVYEEGLQDVEVRR